MPESFPGNVENNYYVALLESKIIGAGIIVFFFGRIFAPAVYLQHN